MNEPLTLEHKEVVTQALAGLDLDLCEYSFDTLFLFRKKYHYKLVGNTALYIEGITSDNETFIMPLGLASWQSPELHEHMQRVDFAFPIPQEWLSLSLQPPQRIWSQDADSDYLYDVTRLAHMSGRHLAKKRNLEKQFLEQYTPSEALLTPENSHLARQVVDVWQKKHVLDVKKSDYEAACEAISLNDQLGLHALIVFVDGVPVGFISGGHLNKRVFAIQFAKADPSYKGIYQYLFHRFCAHIETECEVVNMEQDLGLASLRQTKHSYHPLRLVPKYRVRI